MFTAFEAASHISTLIGSAAFSIAGISWIVDRVQRKSGKPTALTSRLLLLAIRGCIAIGVLSILGHIYLQHEAAASASVYEIRVVVLGNHDTPVEDAVVWSSVGGEQKKISGGWQFDVPRRSTSGGGVTLYAKVPNTPLQGKASVQLGSDNNPTVTITLQSDDSASVRGSVEDTSGRALLGVEVSVVGYAKEAVVTSTGGSFELPAHVTEGQTVRLHAEVSGYRPLDQDQPAGDFPVILVLKRDRENH
jgi:hypothetical protein